MDIVKKLREEAARNARMQGDKHNHTNARRKTFRFRNHLFAKAADRIEELEYEVKAEQEAQRW